MSNNAINVRQQFLDSTGQPRANGYLYFYENKTTTLATIYSDELLSVAQTNPYRLNANGEIEGDVKYSGKLTVVATNSDGSDPHSDDDVEPAAGSEFAAYAGQFQTVENSPAAMAVVVKAGKVMNGETLVSVANQTTATITAPVSNPRIDRIVIDKLTGIYSIVAGSESATPTAPAIPVGKMPSAQIALSTSTTTITDSLITDERISGSVEPSNINTTETFSNKTIGDTNTINAQTDAFTIDDATTATKQVDFDVSGATASTKTTLDFNQTANRIVTVPDATDTLVGKATTDTLTNKTINLTSNTLSGTTAQFNTALSDDNFATLTNAVTLTNKTIGDTNTINAQTDAFTIDDATTATKQVDFDVSGATASTKTTLDFNQTANRTITIPNATDTLVGKATTDILTNKTIGDTNTIVAQDDAFSIADSADATLFIDFNASGTTGTKTTIASSQTTNKTITLPDATDTLVGKATTDTLTNKTINLTSNTLSGTTAQFNTALSDDDFATLNNAVTLTNKTIGDTNTINAQDDAFTINDAADATLQIDFNVAGTTGTKTTIASSQTSNKVVTLPDATDTLVGKSTTDTLTNKTLASPVCTGTTTVATLVNATLTLNGGYYTSETTSTSLGNTTLDSLNTGAARNCTAIGSSALTSNTTGSFNNAFGSGSLSTNISGTYNNAFGYNSLNANTGNTNNSFGYNSLLSNTTGSSNVAFGHRSLESNLTGDSNTSIGSTALLNNTASNNSALGSSALNSNTSGSQNCAFGNNSLSSNTTSSQNSAFGYNSLTANTTGTQNVAVGYAALDANTTASSSTAVGYNALTASTGTQNTAIGSSAGSSTTTGTNVTLVGYNAQATAATTSNEITLGDANVTTLRCATTTITAISDERDKDNIQDLEQGLDFVKAVRSVSYDWNMRGTDRKGPDTGFTAQQLQEVQKQFGIIPGLVHDENPDRLEVGYGKMIPVLVKAIQELSSKVEELESALQNK